MSQTAEAEFRRQIDLLLKLGVIRHSRAGYYSHGFMVPKPGGKMRLVIDFKNLNLVSEKESGWGIPNIKDILVRLGEQKSGYFCKLDLTAGFHQTPISEDSRIYTAFKTSWGGLYEWCRLPMGLKGSPAYFQQIMSTEILNGLVMNICEVYLDDVIIYAPTEELLLERLKLVLERFREKGMTLNPQKCTMCVPEVEYCGHLLDKDGIHFERSKLDSILNFKRPETQQQLRAFLGLANWFRDHVANHSRLVRPLHALLKGYSKHQRINWTQELLQVYEDTKKAVHECPKLFFLDDISPIYLHTDASQYGMGAYLFQVREGKEVPIHFLSKSFDDRLSRWSTLQQEGYAIYYAITSWEHLLRDRRFLVRTDHANLRLLHEESNAKVLRWMLTLQSYDFDIEHIAGKNNTVAEGFSRLCSDERTETSKKIRLSIETETESNDETTGTGNHHTESKNDRIGNGHHSSVISSNLTEREDPESEGFIDLLDVLDNTNSPTVPKAFLMLMSGESDAHLEIWALDAINYEALSDSEIRRYLATVHNDVAGHFAVNKTLEALRNIPEVRAAIINEPLMLRGLRAKCRRYINECATCQKHSFAKIVNRAAPFTVSEYSPMDTYMIDYIEGLPEDSEGHKNIVVIVDCFSRFCTLHATKTTGSEELARKLLHHSSLFGSPCRLVSDRGSALTSDLIKDYIALVGTEHIKTLTASKEENAIVERLNREVMRHLRNIVFDRQVYEKWSHMLPFINRILITTTHSSTGMSPAEIVYGRSIHLERGILAPLGEEVETIQKKSSYKEYITNMWNSQQTIISKARSNLETKDAKNIAQRLEANEGEVTRFPIHSYVLAEPLNYFTIRKETNKLKTILKGPFKVVAISDDSAKYTVLNLVRMRLRVYHVSALRAFHARPEDTDLTKYAVRDSNFYMVRSIKGFKPKTFKLGDSRKTLEFQIEWDIDGSLTWEPWSGVRSLLAVRKWVQSTNCTNKALKALFPVQVIPEEIESDEENAREVIPENTPYWPNLESK